MAVHAGLVQVLDEVLVHTWHVVAVAPAAYTCWEEEDDESTERDKPKSSLLDALVEGAQNTVREVGTPHDDDKTPLVDDEGGEDDEIRGVGVVHTQAP